MKFRKTTYIVLSFWMLLLLFGCGTQTNQYEQAARNAAQKVVSNEVAKYTWTTVKAGNLEYEYTLYCEELNQYQVVYLSKFDEADDPKDQWLEVTIILTGNSLSVQDSDYGYLDAANYERFKIPYSEEWNGHKWFNIDNPQ